MTTTPTSLDAILRPQSIALVGATERSIWSNSAYGNLKRFGYKGALHLVNHKGGQIYKQEAATSCSTIGAPIDMALIMVPEAAIADTLVDLGKSGVKGAVLLSSGFAESGAGGADKQRRLFEQAREQGVRLIGPNCLGFINYVDSIPLWTVPMRKSARGARLAVITQSGALGGQIGDFAFRLGIGLTYMVSTGNEADIDIAEVLEFLVSNPETEAISLFVETVRNPPRFAAAAREANKAGKPVVVLKVGRSEKTRHAAQAHTGALVGDDRVFDAVCQQLGIIRVNTLEELIVTGDIAGRIGRLSPGGVGFVSMSGGLCEIAADTAHLTKLTLPDLASATRASLQEVLTEFGTPNNPLDVTGAAMLKPELYQQAIARLGADPAIAMLACVFDAPQRTEGSEFAVEVIKNISAGLKTCGKPGLMVSHMMNEQTMEGRPLVNAIDIHYSGAGVALALPAIAALTRWSRLKVGEPANVPTTKTTDAHPVNEQQCLRHLAQFGVPVVEAHWVTSAAQAAEVAARIARPLALKIASADIAHKTEVGGVALNVAPADAGREFDQMIASVKTKAPNAKIDGVVLSAMRGQGVELIVGINRDPHWGPVIAVGLGGVLVEALQDSALRRLPIKADDALEMLGELRGSKLLDGFRGSAKVDRTALAETIVRIGDAALALGEQLETFEINPLLAADGRIEALDALAVWNENA